MSEKRKYELKQRAEKLEATRRAITEATVELHRTVGPAATQISEIARRAGVQRATVYSHFPDEASLFAACSSHWRTLHPAPDPSAWLREAEPGGRLRLGLRELYAWYRETEPMMSNILRDVELVPAMRPLLEGGLGAYLESVRAILTDPFRRRGRRGDRVDAAARAATDFHLWRALQSLGDDDAARLAAGLIELAAAP